MLCGTGLHFGQVKESANKPFSLLLNQTEVYFPNRKIMRAVEMNSDKIAICPSQDEFIHIIDRRQK